MFAASKSRYSPMKNFQLILISLICFLSSNSVGFAENGRVVFGMPAWIAPDKLYRMNKPLMKFIEEKIGQKTIFILADDYEDLAKKMEQKKIDFGFFTSNAYIQAKYKIPQLKYLATVQIKSPSGKIRPYYKGMIITLLKSPFHSIEELKGKRFAFTSPTSRTIS